MGKINIEELRLTFENELLRATEDKVEKVFEDVTNFSECSEFLIDSFKSIRTNCEFRGIDPSFLEGELSQVYLASMMYCMYHAKVSLAIHKKSVKLRVRNKRNIVERIIKNLDEALDLLEENIIWIADESEGFKRLTFKRLTKSKEELCLVAAYMDKVKISVDSQKGRSSQKRRNAIKRGFVRAVYKIYCDAVPTYSDEMRRELSEVVDIVPGGAVDKIIAVCLVCSVYEKRSDFPVTNLKNILKELLPST